MNRSRYRATMSRWSGSSNQSRERNRRFGRELESMPDCALRQPGCVYSHAEQPTGERLLRVVFLREPFPGGGDVKGAQIGAAEGLLGDVRARHPELAEQRAVGRVLVEAPAAVEPGPQRALRVRDGAVGVAVIG